MTDDFFWGPGGVLWDGSPPPPNSDSTSRRAYTYRTFGTSMWFRPDGSPVSPSEHLEIDRRMNALLRKSMEPA